MQYLEVTQRQPSSPLKVTTADKYTVINLSRQGTALDLKKPLLSS